MNLDLSHLCRDPAEIQAYREDRLVHNRMTAGTYHAIIRLRDDVFAGARGVQVPALLLCGGEDRIISLAAARLWYSRLAGEKRRVEFPGCFHELHHEPVRDEVVRLVADWVTRDGP